MGIWSTIPNGARVFIKDGQDLSDAFRSNRELITEILSFEKQVEILSEGVFNKRDHIVVMDETPEILTNLGLSNLSISISSSKLERMMTDKVKSDNPFRSLDKAIIMKFPDAIKNPREELKSSDNSHVIVSDLKDKNKDRIILV